MRKISQFKFDNFEKVKISNLFIMFWIMWDPYPRIDSLVVTIWSLVEWHVSADVLQHWNQLCQILLIYIFLIWYCAMPLMIYPLHLHLLDGWLTKDHPSLFDDLYFSIHTRVFFRLIFVSYKASSLFIFFFLKGNGSTF